MLVYTQKESVLRGFLPKRQALASACLCPLLSAGGPGRIDSFNAKTPVARLERSKYRLNIRFIQVSCVEAAGI